MLLLLAYAQILYILAYVFAMSAVIEVATS